MSCDRVSLALQSEIGLSATTLKSSQQSEHPKRLSGVSSTTWFSMDTSVAQWQTGTSITRAKNEVEHKTDCNQAKCAKKSRNVDREYMIHQAVCNTGRGKNSGYIISCDGNTAIDDIIPPVHNTSPQSIMIIGEKEQTKVVKRRTWLQCKTDNMRNRTPQMLILGWEKANYKMFLGWERKLKVQKKPAYNRQVGDEYDSPYMGR